MPQTIIIFGASGFIGTHMLRHYAKDNNNKLFAVDIKPPREELPSVTYINHDVRDLSSFDVDAATVDLIINLAAVHTTPGHPTHEYYETNILGASETTAFARRKNTNTLIFTSSISVYGPGEESKNENSTLAPISAYGRSKAMAEKIHEAWCAESEDRRLIVCRPAVIFGTGEGGNFTRLASLLRKGFFIYPGRTDTIKACFYVKDLIAAFDHALSLKDKHIIFNGCYAQRYTISNIIETFKETAFPNIKTFLLPKWILLLAAALLRPLALFDLGIHPDRILKLVNSTDIQPKWLEDQNIAKKDGLAPALLDWKKETSDQFK